MKKCPACNSSKYEKIKDSYKCSRCGFQNLSEKELKEKLKNNNFKN